MNIIVAVSEGFLGRLEPLVEAMESLRNHTLVITADLEPQPMRLTATICNEMQSIDFAMGDINGEPFMLCGIGYHGCRLAHDLAGKNPDRVRGVILCPDSSGLDGLYEEAPAIAVQNSLAPCIPALPPIRGDAKSEIAYSIVHTTADPDYLDGNAMFLGQQGRRSETQLGIHQRFILCDGLEELVTRNDFIRAIEELARETEQLARMSPKTSLKLVEMSA